MDDEELAECPVCGAYLEAAELPQHVELCLLAQEQDQQQGVAATAASADGLAADRVACSFGCGAWLSLDELDSHEEAHRLQLLEAEHAQLQHQAAAADEAKEFEALQAKYGFSDKRPGKCFTCGEDGHWSNTCPKNPRVTNARPSQPLSTAAAELVQQQRPDPAYSGAVDVVPLLVPLLQQQGGPPSTVYLCGGPVYHYSRQYVDSGWGCGYRNIQMLCGYLLQRDPAYAAALFGGRGFVPDIPSLQAWLEAAWGAGFDVHGAAQFGGSVQGSRKWIGTPEAAALLRSFGVRAQVVEFLGHSPITVSEDGTMLHQGVTCDICGCSPLAGVRHHSTIKRDFDVCSRCITSPAAEQAGPYIQITGNVAKKSRKGKAADAGGPGSSSSSRTAGGAAGPDQAGSSGGSSRQTTLLDVFKPSNCNTDSPAAAAVEEGGGVATACGQYSSQGFGQPAAAGGSQSVAVRQGSNPSKQQRGRGRGRGRQGSSDGGGPDAAAAEGGGPGVSTKHWKLLEWLWDFFTAPAAAAALAPPPGADNHPSSSGSASSGRSSTQVYLTTRPPLYLQHDGHSRTLVGIERRAAAAGSPQPWEYVLLLLDPGVATAQLTGALRSGQQWQRLVKRGAHTMRKPEYQLLVLAPGLAAPGSEEHQALKTVTCAERYS